MLTREQIVPGETFVRVIDSLDDSIWPEHNKVCLITSWSHSPECVRVRRRTGEQGLYNVWWLHQADFRVGDHVKIKGGQFVYEILRFFQSMSDQRMADLDSVYRPVSDLEHVGWDVPVSPSLTAANASEYTDAKGEAIAQLKTEISGLEDKIARLETENTNLSSICADWKDRYECCNSQRYVMKDKIEDLKLTQIEVDLLREKLAGQQPPRPPESYLTIGLTRAWVELSAALALILTVTLCTLRAPWRLTQAVATQARKWKRSQFARARFIGWHDGTVDWPGLVAFVVIASVLGLCTVALPSFIYWEQVVSVPRLEAQSIFVRPGPTMDDPRERAWFREVQRQRQAAAKKVSWQ